MYKQVFASKRWIFFIMMFLFVSISLSAGSKSNEVRLFQSYFFDTPISKAPYVEPGLSYATYGNGFSWTLLGIGAKGGYAINEKLEIQGELQYLSMSPEEGEGQSGISDLSVYGRYNIANSGPTTISAGGMITLPIGSEDIGQGNLNFGAFGAVRHQLDNGIIITGNLGLIFYETTEYEINWQTGETKEETKYKNYFQIGAGVIYPMNDQMSIVGEFLMQSEGEYMLLSGGVDYALGSGKLRGGLGIGLDDGAPDFIIVAGYGITL